jgi:hypothetical protein
MPDTASVRARVIQRQFEEQYAADPNVVGIGLGLNAAADGPALSVQVTRPPAAGSFPEQFGGLEVIVLVVGEIVPH